MRRLIVLIAASVFALKSFAQTVTIGTQVWMTKNLNVSTFRNGDAIPEAKTDEEWKKAGQNKQPAWCYYDNDPTNGVKYGKLYNWYAVNDPRGLAPVGYHIPSVSEWTKLEDYLTGFDARRDTVKRRSDIAGAKMKSKQGWSEDGNGTNSSGFSGVPGGYRVLPGDFRFNQGGGAFNTKGEFGCWWGLTEDDADDPWHLLLSCHNDFVYSIDHYGDKDCGFSVRCLRD